MDNNSSICNKTSDVLLVARADGILLPVYEPALQYAEGWPWKIKRDYSKALLIRSTGDVLEVINVEVRRPYGKTVLSKVFSVLNLNWEVSLQTVGTRIPQKKVIQAILHGLSLDRATGRSLFDKIEEVPSSPTESGKKNLSIEEVFSRLSRP